MSCIPLETGVEANRSSASMGGLSYSKKAWKPIYSNRVHSEFPQLRRSMFENSLILSAAYVL